MLANPINHIKDVYFRLSIALMLAVATAQAQAQTATLLPTQAPTAGDSAGNFLTLFGRWFSDGSAMTGAAITVACLLGTAWLTFAKVNEARDPKNPSEWGDVFKVGIGCSVASMFAGYIVTQAITVFQTV